MIFCKNIMEITLLYYIYHLVFLKQINIFYKDFSIKINFQIPPSCSFFLILHLHIHDSKVVEFIFEYILYKIFLAF